MTLSFREEESSLRAERVAWLMGVGSRPHQKAFFLQGPGPPALVPCEVPEPWKTTREFVPGSLQLDLGSYAAARNVNMAALPPKLAAGSSTE